MSEELSTTGEALSFERAEFENEAPPALACAFCSQPISGLYWQISKRPACARCRERLQHTIADSMSSANFMRALGYGVAAAAAGSVAWIVISKLTGYEIGIVAIGIGYLVGKAVRKGAGGFGSPRYQVLAIFLTYSAIALASLPTILGVASATSQASFLTIWPTVIALAFASPFLGGMENFMGLIIIGIGLYEAWKLTRPVPVHVLGPFAMEPSVPAKLALARTVDATD